jgi:hypothetical protein
VAAAVAAAEGIAARKEGQAPIRSLQEWHADLNTSKGTGKKK